MRERRARLISVRFAAVRMRLRADGLLAIVTIFPVKAQVSYPSIGFNRSPNVGPMVDTEEIMSSSSIVPLTLGRAVLQQKSKAARCLVKPGGVPGVSLFSHRHEESRGVHVSIRGNEKHRQPHSDYG